MSKLRFHNVLFHNFNVFKLRSVLENFVGKLNRLSPYYPMVEFMTYIALRQYRKLRGLQSLLDIVAKLYKSWALIWGKSYIVSRPNSQVDCVASTRWSYEVGRCEIDISSWDIWVKRPFLVSIISKLSRFLIQEPCYIICYINSFSLLIVYRHFKCVRYPI